MNRHKRFTKAFADEAVALLQGSRRTRRQVAEDLGIDLSTLARWSRDSREHGEACPIHRWLLQPNPATLSA